MNQTALKKRYGLTTKQFTDVLQNNLPELNKDGEHAVLDGNHWILDEVGVSRLDEMLHYVPDLPIQSTDTSKNALKAENEELKSKVEELQEYLIKAEATLDETLKKHKSEKKDYENQLEELTKQIYATQEGQKNLSDNLIRKYKNDAEKANASLEYERAKSKDKIESQAKMIEELQSREKDYIEKLKKYLELRNEHLRLQNEITVSSEEQQKLLRQLGEKNEYVSQIEDVLNNAKATNKDYSMANTLLIKDINTAMTEILNVITNLQNSVDNHAISSEAKKALVNEIEKVSNRQRRMMGYEEETPQETPAEEAEDTTATEAKENTEEAQEGAQAEKIPEENVLDGAVVIPLNEKRKAKGEAKLLADNESLDTAIAVLRESQDKQWEEVKTENENKKKGLLARVASWFIA
ncbi:MAG: hypothetical protein J6N51_13420 [Selenomonas sp.]|nr:hypothetical protein [Selenomonas sp.]